MLGRAQRAHRVIVVSPHRAKRRKPLFVLPTATVRADVTAAAVLIDVLQGYPYAHAQRSTNERQVMSAWGSGAEREALQQQTRATAVRDLSQEVEDMMKRLRQELRQRQS